jgi:hypothetical protein
MFLQNMHEIFPIFLKIFTLEANPIKKYFGAKLMTIFASLAIENFLSVLKKL